MCVTNTTSRRKSLTFSCFPQTAPLRLPSLPNISQLRRIQGEVVSTANRKDGIAPVSYDSSVRGVRAVPAPARGSKSAIPSNEYIRREAVHHDYHDHSQDKPEYANVPLSSDGVYKRPKAKGGVTTPFPMKLHEMLDEIERDGHGDVISWQPHGRCFVVHKPKEFVDHVMPTYFKQTKIASFQRQLNLYGFNRLTTGADKGGYYHELFLRGKVFLSHRIQRIKVKGTRVRAPCSPDTEPNFYAMPPVTSSHTPPPQPVKSADLKRKTTPPPQQPRRVLTPPPLPMRIAVPQKRAACPPTKAIKREETSAPPAPPLLSAAEKKRPIPPPRAVPAQFKYYPRVRPMPCTSSSVPALPIVSPPEATKPKMCLNKVQQDDEDDVVMFEGKPFHYLEPFDEKSVSNAPATAPASPPAPAYYRVSGSISITPVARSMPVAKQAPPKQASVAPDMISSLPRNSFDLSFGEKRIKREADEVASLSSSTLPRPPSLAPSVTDSDSDQNTSSLPPLAGESISSRPRSMSFIGCMIPDDIEDDNYPGFPTFKEDVESFFAGFEMPVEQYHEAMNEVDDDIVFGRLLEEAIE